MSDYAQFIEAKSQGGADHGFEPLWLPDFLGVEFRRVPDFRDYAVGTDGSIWSSRSRNGKGDHGQVWRRLRPRPLEKGHLLVGLRSDGRVSRFLVHRLVLLAFIGPCPDGMEACHFPDRDPSNNCLDNLRWATHAKNMADKVAHGTDNRGEKHPLARLTESQVREILDLHAAGYCTQRQIGDRFDVHSETIGSIVRRESWRHL